MQAVTHNEDQNDTQYLYTVHTESLGVEGKPQLGACLRSPDIADQPPYPDSFPI